LLAGSNLTNPIVLGHLHLSGAGFPGADAGAGAGRRAGGRGPCHGAGGDPAFPGHPFALPIGLNLFVTGALAWLLWPRAARETGAQPSVARASRIGAGAVPEITSGGEPGLHGGGCLPQDSPQITSASKI
jgi:hypothetical protein